MCIYIFIYLYSTGGVAEVFEAGNESNEVILLKERIGLIKLAFRTVSVYWVEIRGR